MQSNNNYVYCYFYPDGTPFYIGVGCGGDNRMYYHLKVALSKNRWTKDTNRLKIRTIRKLLENDQKIIIEKVATGLSRQSAFDIERFLVQFYGRKDLRTGPLTNMTDGGDGPLNREPWNKGDNEKSKWMSKGNKSIQVNICNIDYYIENGWIFGRKNMEGRPAPNKGKSCSYPNRDQSGDKNPTAKYYWIICIKDEIFIKRDWDIWNCNSQLF